MEEQPQRKGFTIIEVALVLAVSGLLLVGIIAGTGGAVARQRYNDSVQNIAEQFRTFYSEVNNPQGLTDSGGASDKAFYGKLIIFGANNADSASIVSSFTVIGPADVNVARDNSASAIALKEVGGNLSIQNDSEATFTAPWEARIEDPDSNSGDLFKGAMLILYSANGGIVHTYLAKGAGYSTPGAFSQILNDAVKTEFDVCVNSPDLDAAGGIRRDIRIAKDGRNSSAVQLIDVNTSTDDQEGNRCQ